KECKPDAKRKRDSAQHQERAQRVKRMSLRIVPIEGLPDIQPGMNLSEHLRAGLEAAGVELERRDILAVTQKVVSKSEGRLVDLRTIEPSALSISIGRHTKKDPRLIQVILAESRRIVRIRNEVVITETHHGFICANAGVDQSNVNGDEMVTLLPKD